MTCRCHDPRVHGHHADCPAGLGPPLSWRNTIPGGWLRPVQQYPLLQTATRPPIFRQFPTFGGTP